MGQAAATGPQLVPTLLWEKGDPTQALKRRFRFADGPVAAQWLCNALQQLYGIDQATVTRLVISAANLLAWVQSPIGPLLIKACANPFQHARLRNQGALVTWLAQQGLPVSAPLSAHEGEWQIRHGHLSLGVQRLVEGELLNPEEPTQAIQAGKVLAQLHQALARYPESEMFGATKPPSLPSSIQKWLAKHRMDPRGRLGIWDLPSLIRSWFTRRTASFVDERLQAAAQQLKAQLTSQVWPEIPKQLVHQDYRAANLLWQDERINAVLDFEETDWGYRVNDLAWATVHLGTRYHHWGPVSAAAEEHFLTAYAMVWPLSPAEQAWWPLLLRWHRLELARGTSDGPTAQAALAALER